MARLEAGETRSASLAVEEGEKAKRAVDGVVDVEVAEAGAGGEVGEPAGTIGRPRPEGVRRCSVGATGWGVGDGAG